MEHKFFSIAQVLFIALDIKGNITFLNKFALKTLGYQKKELLGKNWFEICLPDHIKEETFKIFFDLMAGKLEEVEYYENPIVKKDGTQCIIAWHNAFLKDSNGNMIGVLSSGNDITNERAIGEKLKKSERITQTILENAPIGIMIIGEDKEVQFINKAALIMAGYGSKKEIIGQSCHKNICPADIGQCPITDLGEKVNQSEKNIICKDGRQVPIYKTALPMKLDGQNVIIETFMDISPLKKAEQKLMENKNRLQTIMGTIVEPVVVYDNQGKVEYVNPGFTRVFGWTFEEIVGQKIDFVPDKEIPATQEAIASVLKGEGLSGFESERKTKNGDTICVLIGAALLIDTMGNPQGFVVNFQDITREKQAMDKLQQTNKKLDKALAELKVTQSHMLQTEKMASIGQLAAGIAHEINNPVGFILSNLDNLDDYLKEVNLLLNHYQNLEKLLINSDQKNLADETKQQVQNIRKFKARIDFTFINQDIPELLNDCREGTIRVGKIVEDLKSFAHPGSDKKMLVDINTQLEITLNIVNNIIKQKAVVLKDFGEIARVEGYPQKLSQVFMNILVNAAQAIKEKGQIKIQTKQENKNVVIVISDNGCGIKKENLSKIFDPFFTTRKIGKGVGLGMNIAYNIIKSHGGRIDVESIPGKGSIFTIVLAGKD